MTRKRLRSNGEGSVHKVQRQRMRGGKPVMVDVWEGSVTLGIVAGKQRRKSVTGATKAEVTAKVRALLNQKDEGTLTTTSSPTLKAWLEHYFTDLAPKKRVKGQVGNRARTIDSYKSLARNHVYPIIGTVKLEQLTVEHLEKAYQEMADKGLAMATIQRAHAMLGVTLGMAWKRGRLPRNVVKLALLPAGAPKRVDRKVEIEEMQRVLDLAKQRRLAAKWVLRIVFGWRQGETLGLTWPDVLWDQDMIRVRMQIQRLRAEHGCGESTGTEPVPGPVSHGCGDPVRTETVGSQGRELRVPRDFYPCGQWMAPRCSRPVTADTGKVRDVWPCGKHQAAKCPQGSGGGLVLVPVKTDASDALMPLPKPIADLLRQRQTEQKRERIQEGPRWKGWEVDGEQVPLVFSQPNGRPFDPHDDWEEWHQLLRDAGVEAIRPHAARGWAATLLVILKVHPKIAMAVLRHADISTTLNIYSQAPDSELRKAAEEMAALMLGKAVSG